MRKKTQNQTEPSRIQKAEEAKRIRDFCGEVLWQIDIVSNQGPYVFQLIKVFSETSGIREKEVIKDG